MLAISPWFFGALALKAAAILSAAGLVALLLRRESASVRHSIWSVGLIGVLVLPALELTLPRWRVLSLPETVGITEPLVAPVAPAEPATAAVRRERAVAPRASTPSVAVTMVTPTAEAPVARAAVAPAIVGLAKSFASPLLLVWLLGTAALLLWIAGGEWWIRRLGRRARAADASEWTDLLPDALDELRIRHRVQVLETDRSLVPMTYGMFHPVVILPVEGRQWSTAHRRDVLVHELAHVARRDCLTHFLARVAGAFHWFNPLVWVALRQLRIEREHASDDAVLNAGALASRYAEELLSTAQAMRSAPALGSAGLALARRSELADRLFSVLDPTRTRRGLDRATLTGIFAVGAAVILPLGALGGVARPLPTGVAVRPAPAHRQAAPVIAQRAVAPIGVAAAVSAEPVLAAAPAARAGRRFSPPSICPLAPAGKGRTVHVNGSFTVSGEGNMSDGKNSYVVWSGRDCSVTIRTNGTLGFNDAETDVGSISGDGRFQISHDEGNSTRVYTVTSKGGELVRQYQVDGATAAMDGAFESWRATLVLEFIRRSAYDAERRSRRILASKGVDGLLAEIDLIPSDWARGQYFRPLVASGSLDDKTVTRIVDQAGRSIESDYALAEVLSQIKPAHLEAESVRQAFVRAAGTMESDYEKRRTLARILAAGKPSPAVTAAMLELAATIESDYEVAELLIGLAKPGAVTGALDAAYLKAFGTIESDYEKHRVLSALFASGPRPPSTVEAALEAARTIGSDYELASFLVELAGKGLITKDLRPLYRRAVGKIESSYERGRALTALGIRETET